MWWPRPVLGDLWPGFSPESPCPSCGSRWIWAARTHRRPDPWGSGARCPAPAGRSSSRSLPPKSTWAETQSKLYGVWVLGKFPTLSFRKEKFTRKLVDKMHGRGEIRSCNYDSRAVLKVYSEVFFQFRRPFPFWFSWLQSFIKKCCELHEIRAQLHLSFCQFQHCLRNCWHTSCDRGIIIMWVPERSFEKEVMRKVLSV